MMLNRTVGIGLLAGGMTAILGIGHLAPELLAVGFDPLTGRALHVEPAEPEGVPQPSPAEAARLLVDAAVATGNARTALAMLDAPGADPNVLGRDVVLRLRAVLETELDSPALAEGSDHRRRLTEAEDLPGSADAVVAALGLDGTALHEVFGTVPSTAGLDAAVAGRTVDARSAAKRYTEVAGRERAVLRWQLEALREGDAEVRAELVDRLESIAPLTAWSIWRTSQPEAPVLADWRRRAELARRSNQDADELLAREAAAELEANVVDLRRAAELRAERGDLLEAAQHLTAAAQLGGIEMDYAAAVSAWHRAGEPDRARSVAVERAAARPSVAAWRDIAARDRVDGRLDRAAHATERALELAEAEDAMRSTLERELAQYYIDLDRTDDLLQLSAARLARGAGNGAEWRQFVELAAGLDRLPVAQRAGERLAERDPAKFFVALPHLTSVTGLEARAVAAVDALPEAALDAVARELRPVRREPQLQSAVDRLIARCLARRSAGEPIEDAVRSLIDWQLLDRPIGSATAVTVSACVRHGADDPRLLRTAARAARRVEDAALESRVLTAALTLAPDDPGLMTQAAEALARDGQWDRAIEQQRRALRAVRATSHAANRAAVRRLAAWLQRVGQSEEAQRLAVGRAEHPAASAEDVLFAADVCLANGRSDRAHYLYRRVHSAGRVGARLGPDAGVRGESRGASRASVDRPGADQRRLLASGAVAAARGAQRARAPIGPGRVGAHSAATRRRAVDAVGTSRRDRTGAEHSGGSRGPCQGAGPDRAAHRSAGPIAAPDDGVGCTDRSRSPGRLARELAIGLRRTPARRRAPPRGGGGARSGSHSASSSRGSHSPRSSVEQAGRAAEARLMTSSVGHGPSFDRWAKVLGMPRLRELAPEAELLDVPSRGSGSAGVESPGTERPGASAPDPARAPSPMPPRTGPWFALLLAFAIALAVEWATCGPLGAVYLRPHPYWVPVLLVAVGCGVRIGVVAGCAAAALWVVGAFRIGEFSAVGDLWLSWRGLEPLGFVVFGFVLGELSDRARRRADAHRLERDVAVRDAALWRDSAERARQDRADAVRRLQFESLGFAQALGLATRIQQRVAVPDAAASHDAGGDAHQRIARVALGLLGEQCAVARAVIVRAPTDTEEATILAGHGDGWTEGEAAERLAHPAVQPALDTGAFLDYLRDPTEGEGSGEPLWVAPLRDADGAVVGMLCVDAFDAAALTPDSVVDARAVVSWCEAAWMAAEVAVEPVAEPEPEPDSEETETEADAQADALGATSDDVRGWFTLRSPRADDDWTLTPLERPLPGLAEFHRRLAVEMVRGVEAHLPPAVLGVELPLDVSRHDPLVADATARDAVVADVALEVLGRGLRSTDGLFIGPNRRFLRVLLPGTKSAGAWIVCERLLRLARTVSPMLAGCSVRVLDASAELEVPEAAAPVDDSALALPGGAQLIGRLGREWHLARRHRGDLHVVHAVTSATAEHLGPVCVAVREALQRPLEELFVPAAGRLTVLLPGADGLRAYAVHDVLEQAVREHVGDEVSIEVFSLGADGPEYQPFLARVLR